MNILYIYKYICIYIYIYIPSLPLGPCRIAIVPLWVALREALLLSSCCSCFDLGRCVHGVTASAIGAICVLEKRPTNYRNRQWGIANKECAYIYIIILMMYIYIYISPIGIK